MRKAATDSACPERPDRGSILLPVIIVLLLIASAATAMTLQARASLREASARRDRAVLGLAADAFARATVVALAQAAQSQASAPFPIDGTPQSCRLPDRRRVILSVQDQGGLVDLNKASPDLLVLVFTRAGLSARDAKSLSDAILAGRSRADGGTAGRGVAAPSGSSGGGFVSADEIDGLLGMTQAHFERLRPLLTVGNGAAGIDPAVAAIALRRLIPPKEMNTPDFQAFVIPSSHANFEISASVEAPSGMRFTRLATYGLTPSAKQGGHFLNWDAPILTGPLDGGPTGAFCARIARAVADP